MTLVTGMLRVMIVEDHPLVRSAISSAIAGPDVAVVAEAASAEEALTLAPAVDPDLMLVDIALPGMSGIHMVRELAPRLPRARIVMLTMAASDRDVADAIRAGAHGYLTKDVTPDALGRAVRAARAGELVMPRGMAARLVERLARRPRRQEDGSMRPQGAPESAPLTMEPEDCLSRREEDILRLLSENLTDREIATALTISVRTVETHVSSILHKMGVRNRAEAGRRYREGT